MPETTRKTKDVHSQTVACWTMGRGRHEQQEADKKSSSLIHCDPSHCATSMMISHQSPVSYRSSVSVLSLLSDYQYMTYLASNCLHRALTTDQ